MSTMVNADSNVHSTLLIPAPRKIKRKRQEDTPEVSEFQTPDDKCPNNQEAADDVINEGYHDPMECITPEEATHEGELRRSMQDDTPKAPSGTTNCNENVSAPDVPSAAAPLHGTLREPQQTTHPFTSAGSCTIAEQAIAVTATIVAVETGTQVVHHGPPAFTDCDAGAIASYDTAKAVAGTAVAAYPAVAAEPFSNGAEPGSNATADQVSNAAAQPVSHAAAEPVNATAAEPVNVTAAEPCIRTIAKPVSDGAAEPVSNTAAEPVNHAAAESINVTAAEPCLRTIAEPVSNAAAVPASHAAADPVSHATAEPASVTAADPHIHAAAEPVSNGSAEPVSNTAAEPVNHAAAEPINVTAAEPVSNGDAEPVSNVQASAPAPGGDASLEAPAPEQGPSAPVEEPLQPGQYPAEFNSPQRIVEAELVLRSEHLEAYRKRRDELQASGRSKPDMIAAKEFRQQQEQLWKKQAASASSSAATADAWLWDPQTHGHPPGVAVGDQFVGKGELACLGIHCNISGGIYYLKGVAWAVCLSGGYQDDDDNGDCFSYTGMGGRDPASGKQVQDQQWTKGNLALKKACENKQPIRVARQISNTSGVQYAYDGLYMITKAAMEVGKEGFIVCKFTMKGIPGHSRASCAVKFSRTDRPVKKKALASQTAEQRLAKAEARLKCQVQSQKVKSSPAASKGKKVMDDISGGKECWPIPAYNDVNDGAPVPIQYITDHFIAEDNIEVHHRVRLAREAWVNFPPGTCGLEHMRRRGYHNLVQGDSDGVYYRSNKPAHPYTLSSERLPSCMRKQGRPFVKLMDTEPGGLIECPKGCATPECETNRLPRSIGIPLELFYSVDRGWGVRTPYHIRAGTFVAHYLGEIITTEQASELHGKDQYLFNLDAYTVTAVQEAADREAGKEVEACLWKPPLPEQLRILTGHPNSPPQYRHLTMDPQFKGNVGRYFNHSCMPNMTNQTVLQPGDNALLYHVAFFASEDIAAGTELTWDYKYNMNEEENDEAEVKLEDDVQYMPCKCGAPNCRKWLRQF